MLGHIFSTNLHPDTTAKTGCLHSWVMKTKVQKPKCDGLNENGPHRLINLRSGSQLVELFEKNWECDLVRGGVSPGGGFEVLNTSLHLVQMDVSSQLLLQGHGCRPAAMLPTMVVMDPSETRCCK